MLATLQRLTAFAALGLVGLPHASVLADPPTQPALRLEPALHPTEDVHGCVVMQYPDGHEVKVVGPDAGDLFGYAGCFINDIDGDGRWDAAITAPLAGKTTDLIGRVYLVASSDGRLLAEIAGEPGMRFGLDVAVTSDVTGDWVNDLLVATSTPRRLAESRFLNDHIQRTLQGQLPITEWVYLDGATHEIFNKGCIERLMRDYLLGRPVPVEEPPSVIRVGDAADLDASGQVDIADLQRLLNVLATGGDPGDLARIARGAGPLGDINSDGLTTVHDLSGLLSDFGEWATSPAAPPGFPQECCAPNPANVALMTWCSMIRFIIDGDDAPGSVPCTPPIKPFKPRPSPPCCPPGVRPPGGGTNPGGSPPGGPPGGNPPACPPNQPPLDLQVDTNSDGVADSGDNSREDTPPGAVVLASTFDTDWDGLPDYADGFNLFGELLPNDNLSAEAEMTPVAVVICLPEPVPSATITVSYSPCDPLLIGTGPNARPLSIPGDGGFRLWRKAPTVHRDGRSITAGGDFIPPGTYTLAQLGFSDRGGTRLFYFESTMESTIPGGEVLSFVSSIGSDTALLTGVSMVIEAQVGDAGEMFESPGFLATRLWDPADPPEPEELELNHQPIRHWLKIYDQRTTLPGLYVGDILLQATPSGGVWRSEPFWIDPTEDGMTEGGLPGLPRVLASAWEVRWGWNPRGRTKCIEVPPATKGDAAMAKNIDRVIRDLRNDTQNTWLAGYAISDTGFFGTEVHRRLFERMGHRQRWQMSVFFDRSTRRVVSIGAQPSNNSNVVEIDAIFLKKGQRLSIGDVFTWDKVDDVYEIKTSANGTMSVLQREKYFDVVQSDRCKTVVPEHKFTRGAGWGEHPRGGKMWRMGRAAALVGPAALAYFAVYPAKADPLMDALLEAYGELELDSMDIHQSPVTAAAFGQALGRFISLCGHPIGEWTAHIAAMIQLTLLEEYL